MSSCFDIDSSPSLCLHIPFSNIGLAHFSMQQVSGKCDDVVQLHESEDPPRYLPLDEVPHAAIALGGIYVVVSLYRTTRAQIIHLTGSLVCTSQYLEQVQIPSLVSASTLMAIGVALIFAGIGWISADKTTLVEHNFAEPVTV